MYQQFLFLDQLLMVQTIVPVHVGSVAIMLVLMFSYKSFHKTSVFVNLICPLYINMLFSFKKSEHLGLHP